MDNRIKFNTKTKMFEAKFGQKLIGEFKTKEDAINKFNEYVTKVFTFPILIKTEDSSNEEDNS